MSKAVPDLIRRHRALEKVSAKYRHRPLDFRDADCIRMARTHLVAMGHRPPQLPRYSDLAGAHRALKKAGFASIEDLLASMLPRIPLASILPGDLAVLQGDPATGLDSVTISVGGQKLLGWYDGKCSILIPKRIEAAFRL